MTPDFDRKPAEILPLTPILGVFREPTANLPLTYRRPTANHPSPYRGSSLGSLPHGGTSTHQAGKVWFVLGGDDLRRLARDRWGAATAFRVGIIAGELGVRMVNPFHGRSASLFREGLRKGRRNAGSLVRDEIAKVEGRK